MRPLNVKSRLEDVATHTTSASSSAFMKHHRVSPPQSPWHSPVPYIFGGLAAILGLITFALLILAYSYWRLSSSGEEDGRNGDEEKESRSGDMATNGASEDKFLVIMAGDNLPRFLATPAMKKCTCGGKMIISHEDIVAEEQEENMRVEEGKEKVKETGETTTTSH